MRFNLCREYLLLLSLICISGNLYGQDATPGVDKSGGQTAAPAPGAGNGPRLIGGPDARGGPQPFEEAKKITQPKSDKELASAVKRLADELASFGRFSGSVLVAADGKPLIEDAWGDADREHKLPNKPETSYDVGSIGKLFTQIAILQLVEAGKVTPDDSFGKYLTNYPNADVAGTVTIRQLLLHSSGMGDFLDSITPATRLSSMRELKDFVPLFAQKPLEFAPGTANRYSNAGYIVLGMVVEAVSGENYYSYIERHILQPAGMTHSGFFERSNLPHTVAHSYEDSRDVTNMHAVRGSPAGGLQASVGDLLRLVQAIDAGKLLKKESLKTLRDLIPHPPKAPLPADETRLTAYGIAGGAPGVSAYLAIDPTGHYTRVVLCNGSPPMAMSMAATISEWIKQMPK